MFVLNDDFENLAMAKKRKYARSKVGIILISIFIIVGGALFWLTLADDVKNAIKIKVLAMVEGNAVEVVTDIMTESSDPLVDNSQVTIKMESESAMMQEGLQSLATDLIDNEPENQSAMSNTSLNVLPNVVAPVEEDSVVSVQFLDDLAQLMVSRYDTSTNTIDLGVKALNIRYGTSLNGLNYEGEDFFAGREYILRYVFSPTMLSGLYKLYSNKFINIIIEAAINPKEGKALNQNQLNDMLKVYSKNIASLAIILTNIANITDLQAKIDDIHNAKQKAIDIQVKMNELIFAFEEEKNKINFDSAKLQQLEENIQLITSEYIEAIDARDNIQNILVKSLRGQGSLDGVDDESLIYVAYWVDRRLETQANAMKSVTAASKLLNDLSSLLQKGAAR